MKIKLYFWQKIPYINSVKFIKTMKSLRIKIRKSIFGQARLLFESICSQLVDLPINSKPSSLEKLYTSGLPAFFSKKEEK